MWAKTTPGDRFEDQVELAKAHCKFSPNTACARADKWALPMTGESVMRKDLSTITMIE